MQSVLLVVDMQNDFVHGALGTKEARAIVPRVVDKIKTFEGPVLFTQDTHEDNYLETQEGQHLPVEHCIRGTDGWEIISDIKFVRDAPIIEKDTFGSKDLIELLKKMHEEEPIDRITIVGLCTDICVISNALLIKAYFPEMEIVVDASCCAGVTPESHETALSAMEACQVTIVS